MFLPMRVPTVIAQMARAGAGEPSASGTAAQSPPAQIWVRPSARGSRVTITDRAVVDMVCLRDMTLDAVLGAHGWSVCREYRQALLATLVGALDRMQGYR